MPYICYEMREKELGLAWQKGVIVTHYGQHGRFENIVNQASPKLP